MRRLVFAFAVALMLVSPAAGADVGIQAYELPRGGGYPHDVAVGADGIVWYTAQRDGKLYNCRDVQEMQCTITSGPGSGKSVKVNR